MSSVEAQPCRGEERVCAAGVGGEGGSYQQGKTSKENVTPKVNPEEPREGSNTGIVMKGSSRLRSNIRRCLKARENFVGCKNYKKS